MDARNDGKSSLRLARYVEVSLELERTKQELERTKSELYNVKRERDAIQKELAHMKYLKSWDDYPERMGK